MNNHDKEVMRFLNQFNCPKLLSQQNKSTWLKVLEIETEWSSSLKAFKMSTVAQIQTRATIINHHKPKHRYRAYSRPNLRIHDANSPGSAIMACSETITSKSSKVMHHYLISNCRSLRAKERRIRLCRDFSMSS